MLQLHEAIAQLKENRSNYALKKANPKNSYESDRRILISESNNLSFQRKGVKTWLDDKTFYLPLDGWEIVEEENES